MEGVVSTTIVGEFNLCPHPKKDDFHQCDSSVGCSGEGGGHDPTRQTAGCSEEVLPESQCGFDGGIAVWI